MTILKHGSLYKERSLRVVIFECEKCGCVFQERTEYLTQRGFTGFYAHQCPECGRKIWSNNYHDVGGEVICIV